MRRLVEPFVGMLALAMGMGLGAGAPSASAQGHGGPGSLGGFGDPSGAAMPGPGAGGPMIIPYGGTFEGFMPGRMGSGSGLSFGTRPAAPMGARPRAFRLSPLPGGMAGMSEGLGGIGAGVPIGSRGAMGLGGGMRRMPAAGGMGVMPPRIGYPFRQPPSLVPAAGGGVGMSM